MKIFKKKSLMDSREGPDGFPDIGRKHHVYILYFTCACGRDDRTQYFSWSPVAGQDSADSDLEKEKEQEEQRTEEIEKYKDYVGTDEYVEDTARDRLGMVKENEILFKAEE